MSYTEYLNRKKAVAPVIVDTRPKMDASTYTRHQRVVAAAGNYSPTNGVINNPMDMNDSDTLATKRPLETSKASGGRVPDASVFTDYAAGLAASKDYRTGPPLGKVVLNGTLAGMTSISGCGAVISEPSPQTTGILAANQVQKGASDWIRLNKDCVASGRLAESHEPGMRGMPQFIDDTISLNTGSLRIGTGSFGTTGSTVSSSNGSSSGCPPANHVHQSITPRASWSARPRKGAGGLVVPSIPRPDDARKVGGLVPSDHTKYVEKHHGNDFNVNPRRVPIPYQIPAGTPAQLKINDPNPTV
jgi:hypothetical protein